MSIQILPENQNAVSALGAAFGQGLGQQIPEEIKRYRLQSGLENLAKGNEQKSPYQVLAGLAAIPGIDPSLIGILAPTLQQQLARNEALSSGNQAISPNQPTAANQSTAPKEKFQGDGREDRPGYLQVASPEQVETLANNLLRSQPFNYPSLDAARSQANRILNQDYEADKAYQSRLDLFENEFEKANKGYLQAVKEDQENEIGGETLERIKQKNLDRVKEGEISPRQAAQITATQIKNLALQKKAMRGIRGGFFTGENNIKSFSEIAKSYKKLGASEQDFIDELVATKGISREAASYIANSDTESAAANIIRKIPVNLVDFNRSKERAFAREVAKEFKPTDSVLSLAYLAKQKGLDPEVFKKELRKNLDPKNVNLLQQNEFDSPTNAQTPLPEVWLLGYGLSKNRPKK